MYSLFTVHAFGFHILQRAPTALQDIEWLEYFAGVGNLTRQMQSARSRSVRFDLEDHKPPKGSKRSNYMDMNTAAGYAFLGLNYISSVFGMCPLWIWNRDNILKYHM